MKEFPHFVALVGAVLVLACAGCATAPNETVQNQEAWLSGADLAQCEAAATKAFKQDFPGHEVASCVGLIIQVEDWRWSRFAVFVPYYFTPGDLVFAVYYFAGEEAYSGKPEAYAFSRKPMGKVKMVGRGFRMFDPGVERWLRGTKS
jgi:hypothetical protein